MASSVSPSLSFDPCSSCSAHVSINFHLQGRMQRPNMVRTTLKNMTGWERNKCEWDASRGGSWVNVLISLLLPGRSAGKHTLGSVGEKWTISTITTAGQACGVSSYGPSLICSGIMSFPTHPRPGVKGRMGEANRSVSWNPAEAP